MICRADNDGKIIILFYKDYDTIMTLALQQFAKRNVPVNGCYAYLGKLRKDCNDLVVEFHAMGALRDEMLLYTAGMKWKNK